MDTKRTELNLSDQVASLRQIVTDRQVMKEELSLEIERLNTRLLAELGVKSCDFEISSYF